LLLISLLWLALLGVLYYGFFPVLFLAHNFKKYILSVSMLGLLGFVNIAVLTDKTGAGGMVSTFIATSFVLPALIVMVGMTYKMEHMQIFYLSHVPGLLCALYFIFSPLSPDVLNPLIEPMVEKFSSINTETDTHRFSVSFFQNLMSRLMAVFWLTDLSIRLIIGSAILSKIQRSRKLDLKIQNLRSLEYPDWPIWIVILGLTGLFYSLYFSGTKATVIPWISAAILIIIAPMYFLRGLSVVFNRFHEKKSDRPWPIYLKILLILLILWAGPTMVIVAVLFGLLDTWIDFRKKHTEQPIER